MKLKHVWVVLAALIAAIVLAGVAGIPAFRSYLRSDAARHAMDARVAGEAKARAGFLPVDWSGMNVYLPGLVAESKPGAAPSRLEARGITAHCDFFSIWRRVITITELDVEHLQVGGGGAACKHLVEELAAQPELCEADNYPSTLTVHVDRTVVGACDIYLGNTGGALDYLKNVATTMRTVNEGLEIEGVGGVLKEATFPELKVDRISLRYAKPSLEITEGKLKLDDGRLTIRGKYDTGNSQLKLATVFEEFPIASFLPEEWRERFQAHFAARADIMKDLSDKGMLQLSGTISFPRARLEHYPAQEKIASLTHKPEFNKLTFTKLGASFSGDHDKLHVRNFEAEVEGLLLIHGEFDIEKGIIDATFEVGIDPSALTPVPGAREKVFTRMRGKYAWTTVKLTGPLKHPREDLSPRLLSAAKEAVVLGFLEFVPKAGINVLMTLGHLF